ncbi:MAG TPA: gamma-glutamyltransferase [Solirubrobacteraceae bacterium]|nr:gamma-glutamyltransferase [Solirubrobacteraceae bacterium]
MTRTEQPSRGLVAAGHQVTAQVGAEVLRDGGNAVDAAVAAMLASFVAEPLLTGLGAGGYMLVAGAGEKPALLDFFVAAPGQGREEGARAELVPIDVSFGDAVQVFHVGPASVGAYGAPAGVCAAVERWGSSPLADLAAPAAQLARQGVALNAEQAYVAEILTDLLASTPECQALWAPDGRILREGDVLVDAELGDALERLGRDGARPFYDGDIAAAVCDWLEARGGTLTREDLSSYRAVEREPVRAIYRGRELLTNPPPSAGGILLAYALALLGRAPGPPPVERMVDVMEAAQAERTPEFMEGLADSGFLGRFLGERLGTTTGRESSTPLGSATDPGSTTHLGSTTHISVLDADALACSVTCTNGEGSGIIVPGTGLHLNNIMGEQDLNPLGFHRHRPGIRMPSMMAPSVVLRDGEVELVLGSAGSNRIRSALLQTIVGVVDHGLDAEAAVRSPRLHFEDGVVYAEPGVDVAPLEDAGRTVARFGRLNLFFGGVQAIQRDPDSGEASGAGDPRRGGVAVLA